MIFLSKLGESLKPPNKSFLLFLYPSRNRVASLLAPTQPHGSPSPRAASPLSFGVRRARRCLGALRSERSFAYHRHRAQPSPSPSAQAQPCGFAARLLSFALGKAQGAAPHPCFPKLPLLCVYYTAFVLIFCVYFSLLFIYLCVIIFIKVTPCQ